MTPDQMLELLDAEGRSDAWFGWRIEGDVLTVTLNPADEAKFDAASWRLVPIGGGDD